jgi:ligand-binding sensor domain-containing protein
LWIATLGGGLSRLRRDGTITTLTTADGLLHDDVSAIARAADGDGGGGGGGGEGGGEGGGGGLWVGTARGLQRWTPGGGFTRVGEADGVSGVIAAMIVSPEGLWASEQGRAMFLYRDGHCERIEEPVELTKKRGLFASAFLVDAAGDLWVSMGNGVVARRHAGKWTELNKSQGVPFSVITCFSQGPDGTIWAGTNDAGVYQVVNGRFVPVPGTSRSVWALRVDADGIAWAGSQSDGLSRLIRPRVTAFRVGDESSRFVHGVSEAPDGSLWVATLRGLHERRLDLHRR